LSTPPFLPQFFYVPPQDAESFESSFHAISVFLFSLPSSTTSRAVRAFSLPRLLLAMISFHTPPWFLMLSFPPIFLPTRRFSACSVLFGFVLPLFLSLFEIERLAEGFDNIPLFFLLLFSIAGMRTRLDDLVWAQACL